MSRTFPIAANNGAQIIPIPGGQAGSHTILLAFLSAPSAGTVTIEQQAVGSSTWSSIQGATGVSIASGAVTVRSDGEIGALRLTFTSLVGGTSPTLWLSSTTTANPARDLMTDGGFGPNRRLRVDSGQTGFFAGRFFRSYITAVIPVAGPTLQFRFTSPIDFILWSQVMQLTQGALELRVYTGATTSGVWVPAPVIGVNRMSERPLPLYSPMVTIETGGDFTGGTEVDLLRVRTSAQNVSASNAADRSSERGLPAGVYHGRFSTLAGGLTVNDAAQLLYSLLWEERVSA